MAFQHPVNRRWRGYPVTPFPQSRKDLVAVHSPLALGNDLDLDAFRLAPFPAISGHAVVAAGSSKSSRRMPFGYLYGPRAVWKDTGQRLLDNTCTQRTAGTKQTAAGLRSSSRRRMAPKCDSLSCGDRKALAKELGEALAMMTVLARQAPGGNSASACAAAPSHRSGDMSMCWCGRPLIPTVLWRSRRHS